MRVWRGFETLALALALCCFISSARAAPVAHELTIAVTERTITVSGFLAAGDGPHPTLLLLHGGQGFTRQLADYRRYASDLADAGFDAYLVTYYSPADLTGLATGQNLFASRLPAWAKLVSEVAGALAKADRASGAVGLIGFSNGGILAVAAGALDARIDAAVVYYGAIPFALKTPITRLPPLLILHGDADRIIPVTAGKNLAQKAREVGAKGDLVIYEGAGHGFATERSDSARDAFQRTVTFLREKLPVQ
jgi:carboxymethylenebutenolidase